MFTMILISSVAVFVALLGSALIWGFDALRADEIEREAVPVSDPPALAPGAHRRASLRNPN